MVAQGVQSEFVMLVDDDILMGPRWTQNCLEAFSDQEGIYGAHGSVEKSLEKYADRTIYGSVRSQNQDTVECDWIGQVYFLQPGMIAPMFAEPMLYGGKHADDLNLCLRAWRYANIRSFVPPHPPGERDLWGNIDPSIGNDAVASYAQKDFQRIRVETMLCEQKLGWEPLFERNKKPHQDQPDGVSVNES